MVNILSMNIRSPPKHSGELKCFINVLGNEFDIIVLTEIGSRNLSTVEHIFAGYVVFYVTADVNFYVGVGIDISEKWKMCISMNTFRLQNHVILLNVKQKVFFVRFTHNNVSFIVGRWNL